MKNNYEEYSYFDIINKLYVKAEELYDLGIIDKQTKNYVYTMKKELDNLKVDDFQTYINYSKSLLPFEEQLNYNNVVEYIAQECCVLQKSDIIEPDVSLTEYGDILMDGELTIQCIPYDVYDNVKIYEANSNPPYKNRISNHAYRIGDIYNIGMKSFKVISAIKED